MKKTEAQRIKKKDRDLKFVDRCIFTNVFYNILIFEI